MGRYLGSAAVIVLVMLAGCSDPCPRVLVEDCLDRGACAKNVDVQLGSPLSETYFRCEYEPRGASPCRPLSDAGVPVAVSYSPDGTRFRAVFDPRGFGGERYHLDAPRNLFSGDRGRFCREPYTDVGGGSGPVCQDPYFAIQECALSGTMTLATDGSGHIVAHFEDHTVEASWRP